MVARRKPSQERSKEKVEGIVEAAKQLIGERGNDAVSMREIAAFAGVAPSSIYQYFPDKNAILKCIMKEYFDRMHEVMVNSTVAVTSLEQLTDALNEGLNGFYRLFKTEPTLATIWAGVQANTVLREMDEQDSIRNAEYLTHALVTLEPQVNKEEAFTAFVLLMNMAGLAVRMALSKSEQAGDALMAELKLVIDLRIKLLVTAC